MSVIENGDVIPCSFNDHIRLGNVQDKSLNQIWDELQTSELTVKLKDRSNLKGKCGVCEYNSICGGCRARAYGVTTDQMDFCGALHEPTEMKGDYLAEDPWCVYQPKGLAHKKKK